MSEALITGIVTRAHGNRFIVFAGGKPYDCQLRKKVKFKTDQTSPVVVGDDVDISVSDGDNGAVEAVQPRRSVLSRPSSGRETTEHVLAANIDCLAIVASIKEPTLKTGLIDRFAIAATIGGLTPVIVLNKIDLGVDADCLEIADLYRSLGYDVFLTSAVDGRGLDEVTRFLGQHRSIMAGHSGVGKSTILNRLIPGIDLPTTGISESTGKGRHTTSHIEMFPLPYGGFVIDSPGIKVLGLWKLEKDDLDGHYPEMASCRFDCRFTHCSHLTEPDCAVKAAVDSGKIALWRYQNYRHIYESL